MYCKSSSIVLLACLAQAYAHGLVTSIQGSNGVVMPGLGIIDGTPRDCSTRGCGAENDTPVFKNNAGPLGKTKSGGEASAAEGVAQFMGTASAATGANAAAKRDFLSDLGSAFAAKAAGGAAGGAGAAGAGGAAGGDNPFLSALAGAIGQKAAQKADGNAGAGAAGAAGADAAGADASDATATGAGAADASDAAGETDAGADAAGANEASAVATPAASQTAALNENAGEAAQPTPSSDSAEAVNNGAALAQQSGKKNKKGKGRKGGKGKKGNKNAKDAAADEDAAGTADSSNGETIVSQNGKTTVSNNGNDVVASKNAGGSTASITNDKRGLLDRLKAQQNQQNDNGNDATPVKTAPGTVEAGLAAAAGKGAQSGLPTVGQDGVINLNFHQVNADGAGPYTAAVDPTSGGTSEAAFQPAQMTINVPGRNSLDNQDKTTDMKVQVQMPAGMKCTGAVGGVQGVCVVRIQNSANAGPFGGSAVFQQEGAQGATGTASAAAAAGSPSASDVAGATGASDAGAQGAADEPANTGAESQGAAQNARRFKRYSRVMRF